MNSVKNNNEDQQIVVRALINKDEEKQKVEILVFPASKSFAILGLITLSLIYAKMTVYFYVKWTIILSPMMIYFFYQFIMSVYRLSQPQNQLLSMQIQRMTILWNICALLITAPLAVSTHYLGELIEKAINQEDISEPLMHLFACYAFTLFVYLLYSISAKKEKEKKNDGIYNTILNFVLSIFGNSVSICAGGVCNSFYFSTLSAFFSAFGIPIAQYIHYLNYICVILLGFSLLSLYSVKESVIYPPFIITFSGACLIIVDMFIIKIPYVIYIGNGLIIGSALWNSKLNKFSFLKRRK